MSHHPFEAATGAQAIRRRVGHRYSLYLSIAFLAFALTCLAAAVSSPAAVPPSPAAVDSDGDGIPDDADCRPLDASVWSGPSAPLNMAVSGDASGTTLAWEMPEVAGCRTIVFDVLRSGSAASFTTAECLMQNITECAATDAAVPPEGTAFYYLIRGENACGENLGTDSAGAPRSGAFCPAAGAGPGAPCAHDVDCASLFCTDGVCCAERCNGVCERCDLPLLAGLCQSVPAGDDPDDECPSTDPPTCGTTGVCAGDGTCQFHSTATICSPPICQSSTGAYLADYCDGSGTCVDSGVASCLPYTCNTSTGACRTTCSDGSQCAFGYGCQTATRRCLRLDGQSCVTNGECLNGACCSNVCRNLATDVNNCGYCAYVCAYPNGYATCSNRTCSLSACVANYGNCDANAGNGCETDLRTSWSHCGSCGHSCSMEGTNTVCSSATCNFVSCQGNYSNCNGSTADGCEVNHHAYDSACSAEATVEYTTCGDIQFPQGIFGICGGVSYSTSGLWNTRRTSDYIRVRADECSSCTADIKHRITLTSPAGTDYDLYVYRACGSAPVVYSAGTGVDQVEVVGSDTPLWPVDDSYDYWVEVRHWSGQSCSSWSLTVEGTQAP